MAVETRRREEKVAPKLFAGRRVGRLLVRAKGQPRHRVSLSSNSNGRTATSGTFPSFKI